MLSLGSHTAGEVSCVAHGSRPLKWNITALGLVDDVHPPTEAVQSFKHGLWMGTLDGMKAGASVYKSPRHPGVDEKFAIHTQRQASVENARDRSR